MPAKKELHSAVRALPMDHLVWAKVKGHPAWPAQVAHPTSADSQRFGRAPKGAVFVRFLVTDECAFIAERDLFEYAEHKAKFCRKSQAKLFLTAVEQAELKAGAPSRSTGAVSQTDAAERPIKSAAKSVTKNNVKKGEVSPVETLPDLDVSGQIESDTSSDDGADLNDFEKEREQIMQRNMQVLQSLAIDEIKFEPASPVRRVSSAPKRRRSPEPVEQRPKSARIAGKVAAGQMPSSLREETKLVMLPAPTLGREKDVWQRERPLGDVPLVAQADKEEAEEKEAEGQQGGPADGEGEIDSVGRPGPRTKAFTQLLQGLRCGPGPALTEFPYARMRCKEQHVAKVVPERIFSVACHPAPDTSLVAVGDKCGNVGFYQPDAPPDRSVTVFAPHVRPVPALLFHAQDPHKVYSCSYEGVARMMDIGAEKFVEVYATESEEEMMASMAADFANDTLYLGMKSGEVIVKDLRTAKAVSHALHDKKVSGLAVNPCNANMIATSALDRSLCLWDVRKLKAAKDAVSVGLFEASVSSVAFDPSGTRVVGTSMDDTVRLFDVKASDFQKSVVRIRHNNQTGRWLTNFKAIFDPSGKHVVVGSLQQPRGIDVFDAKTGKQTCRLTGDFFQSVASLLAFHPTMPLLAGGNSSGRVSVFSAKK
jgi:hypothetical protein